MSGWYMIIDVEKCENCKNCFLACKDEYVNNDWPGYSAPMPNQGQSWIITEGKERGQYPLSMSPICPPPACTVTMPPASRRQGVGAIYKRPDGIVIIDQVKAKGNRGLLEVCPYGAIRWNEALSLPQKCTLCAHLLDNGWKQTRCVQSCPTGALALRRIETSKIEQTMAEERIEVYHPEFGTRPRVFYKNLHRYTQCFIGASVATRINDQTECAEGARVTLLNASGAELEHCLTDNYGDFKFDKLEEGSGTYAIRVELKGHETKNIEFRLTTSLNLGTIFV